LNSISSDFKESKSTVLLVDDEKMVLDSLSAFLELETEYRVEAFVSPEKALEFAADNEVDLVLSDFLMPGMNGLEFLQALAEIRPYAPRILLTGYADKDSAIRAINELGLFQYIEKPWNNDDLLIVLRNALERRFLIKALQEKIAEIDAAEGRLSGLQKDILRTFI
jgi:DNA-binding NtrC family response regulator